VKINLKQASIYMQFAPQNKGTEFKDRFISSRGGQDFESKFTILDEFYDKSENDLISPPSGGGENDNIKIYQSLLQNQVLGITDSYTIHHINGESEVFKGYPYKRRFNVLDVKYSKHEKENSQFELPPSCGFQQENLILPLKMDRKISKVPFKVLDAPALQDDFYLNVVDWSVQNILAVGLGSCVYLWSANSGKVTKLNDVGPSDSITSVSWSPRGTCLSIGTYSGVVQIWDTKKCKLIRLVKGHESRVGSLSWNSKILSTGSRDKSILHRDLRQKTHSFAKLLGHKQEVCGLKWSFDEQQLSSGGNDNKLLIWSIHNFNQPTTKFSNHTAAVKALAWSPHQHGLLASGGGTADRCIRFWNTLTNSPLSCIDTGSQVCNLLFSRTMNELVSTHGYSQNQIIVWKYSNMRKIATLTGHTYRVLYLAMSSDGQTIVTGAGDETLRFWNAFPPKTTNVNHHSCLIPSGADLR
jgi:cell division cycle 20-like protein 1, cofactor of APC complex